MLENTLMPLFNIFNSVLYFYNSSISIVVLCTLNYDAGGVLGYMHLVQVDFCENFELCIGKHAAE